LIPEDADEVEEVEAICWLVVARAAQVVKPRDLADVLKKVSTLVYMFYEITES
jgi:hypothetical protein